MYEKSREQKLANAIRIFYRAKYLYPGISLARKVEICVLVYMYTDTRGHSLKSKY